MVQAVSVARSRSATPSMPGASGPMPSEQWWDAIQASLSGPKTSTGRNDRRADRGRAGNRWK